MDSDFGEKNITHILIFRRSDMVFFLYCGTDFMVVI